MSVVKFPYSACRRAYSRRPRISKNGTPEERAAKAAAKPAAASVTKISRGDFSFEAYDLKPSQLLDRYDRDRDLVGILQGILEMDSATLKKKAVSNSAIEGFIGPDWREDLIHDFKAASDGFEALAELFACAAARLETIEARLV